MNIDSITIVLTSGCNLRCRYCHLQPQGRRTLTWPSLRVALDVLLAAGHGPVHVQFTGGEPLVARSVMERAVTHVESVAPPGRITWEIVTNGVLLDREVANFLDAHGFSVDLSLDGGPDVQVQRGRGTFEKLDALLDSLKTTHPSLFERLTILMTLSPPTVDRVAESVAYLLSKDVPTIRMNPASPSRRWSAERIQSLDRAFDRAVETLQAHYERTGAVPVTLFRRPRPDVAPPPSEWVCGAHRTDAVTVDVDGRAYGCLVAAATYQPSTAPVLHDAVAALALGPVDAPDFEQRLAEMPERARACGAFTHPEERYSTYRRCRDCEFLARCYACPLAGASDPTWDDVRRVPDFVCAFNQVTLAHRDRFPCQPTPAV